MGSTRRNGAAAGLTQAVKIGVAVFCSATVLYYFSETAMTQLHVALALPLLLVIIGVGVLMDMLGTAVAAADEPPFHAMAAKRLPGARQAIWLLRRAPVVASFSNDIVGDIAGTISGAAAATIAYQTARWLAAQQEPPQWLADLTGVVAVGLVAALTVGGKAAGKTLAIHQPNAVIHRAGRMLAWLERVTGWEFTANGRGSRRRGR
ncbi:MAG: hypothetical protein DIU70_000715 [Bacillota bacterium]|nr:MAG: hypothetical protein DIU70_04905 [Bacillota bacterium]